VTPELLRTVVRAPTDAPERSPLMEVRAVAAAGDGDGDPLLAPSRQRSFEEIRVLDPTGPQGGGMGGVRVGPASPLARIHP